MLFNYKSLCYIIVIEKGIYRERKREMNEENITGYMAYMQDKFEGEKGTD